MNTHLPQVIHTYQNHTLDNTRVVMVSAATGRYYHLHFHQVGHNLDARDCTLVNFPGRGDP